MRKKLTKEEFIERAVAIHGNAFDYSLVELNGVHSQIVIKCNSCQNTFKQSAISHYRGSGCPHCWELKLKTGVNRLTANQFSNKYLLDSRLELIEFNGIHGQAKVICLDCDAVSFKTGNALRRSIKCPECGNGEAINKKWDRKRVERYLSKNDLTLLSEGNDFMCMQTYIATDLEGFQYEFRPNDLKNGYKPNMFMNSFAFENLKLWVSIYRPEYEIASRGYISNTEGKTTFKYNGFLPKGVNPKFKCKVGAFIHTKTRHPFISETKGEKRIIKFLKNHRLTHDRQKTFSECRYKGLLKFDACVYDRQTPILIEFNGEQHYSHVKIFHKTYEEFLEAQQRDQIKIDYCKKKGYKLIVIPYWEKENIETILTKELSHIKGFKQFNPQFLPPNFNSGEQLNLGL